MKTLNKVDLTGIKLSLHKNPHATNQNQGLKKLDDGYVRRNPTGYHTPQPIVHQRSWTTWTMGSAPIPCRKRPQGQGCTRGASDPRRRKAHGPPWQGGLSLLRRGGWCGARGRAVYTARTIVFTAPPGLQKVVKPAAITAADATNK